MVKFCDHSEDCTLGILYEAREQLLLHGHTRNELKGAVSYEKTFSFTDMERASNRLEVLLKPLEPGLSLSALYSPSLEISMIT